MNKQQSKETLKEKVKGIFGLGTQRQQTKQCDSKLPEFIITADIIKVSKTAFLYIFVQTLFLVLSPGAPPLVVSLQLRVSMLNAA